ncbi:hypothetical protein SAMN04487949_2311 [Halogranum gelatinilyticum]|uniref:Uncharacterized protein n=1 Tax=Halogranum gelatinilyticum TaxID=660521 RepID=A0A1G9US03_9EURY|nr:hypothetical protein [Halogranum gelatinilyticum]SDM62682.1 hypothetical protein SAMN04487949_2311 [Halogranum gelatinilyticum]
MPSKNALGIAPLVCGAVLLSGTMARLGGDPVGTVSSVALAAQFLGGVAAIVVGVGILSGWRSFGSDDTDASTETALATVTAVALALGVVGVVFG